MLRKWLKSNRLPRYVRGHGAEDVFNNAKPGEKLFDRILVCQMISNAGIELSSGRISCFVHRFLNRQTEKDSHQTEMNVRFARSVHHYSF